MARKKKEDSQTFSRDAAFVDTTDYSEKAFVGKAYREAMSRYIRRGSAPKTKRWQDRAGNVCVASFCSNDAAPGSMLCSRCQRRFNTGNTDYEADFERAQTKEEAIPTYRKEGPRGPAEPPRDKRTYDCNMCIYSGADAGRCGDTKVLQNDGRYRCCHYTKWASPARAQARSSTLTERTSGEYPYCQNCARFGSGSLDCRGEATHAKRPHCFIRRASSLDKGAGSVLGSGRRGPPFGGTR